MKQVFYANSKWNLAQIFAAANVSLAFVLFFILGFYGENMPQWLPLTLPLFVWVLYAFIKKLTLFPVKIELNSSFIFFFLFQKLEKRAVSFILYLAGIFGFLMNVTMLYLFIFKL